MSEVIVQTVGVRQGCILSPCLFSLFIADLPAFLKDAGGQGVKLNDAWVRVLLFADDGAIVANSAADLQSMLDALHVFCSKWRLLVNVEKTEVLVFLDSLGIWKEHHFLYNNVCNLVY